MSASLRTTTTAPPAAKLRKVYAIFLCHTVFVFMLMIVGNNLTGLLAYHKLPPQPEPLWDAILSIIPEPSDTLTHPILSDIPLFAVLAAILVIAYRRPKESLIHVFEGIGLMEVVMGLNQIAQVLTLIPNSTHRCFTPENAADIFQVRFDACSIMMWSGHTYNLGVLCFMLMHLLALEFPHRTWIHKAPWILLPYTIVLMLVQHVHYSVDIWVSLTLLLFTLTNTTLKRQVIRFHAWCTNVQVVIHPHQRLQNTELPRQRSASEACV